MAITELNTTDSLMSLNNDPVYIHNTLVTDIFDGANFDGWKMSMKIALSAKNKLGFITGSLLKPDATYARWERCNDMICAWLLNGLSKEIRRSVLYSETAKEIWDDLQTRYDQVNGAQFYSVKKDLNTLVQDAASRKQTTSYLEDFAGFFYEDTDGDL